VRRNRRPTRPRARPRTAPGRAPRESASTAGSRRGRTQTRRRPSPCGPKPARRGPLPARRCRQPSPFGPKPAPRRPQPAPRRPQPARRPPTPAPRGPKTARPLPAPAPGSPGPPNGDAPATRIRRVFPRRRTGSPAGLAERVAPARRAAPRRPAPVLQVGGPGEVQVPREVPTAGLRPRSLHLIHVSLSRSSRSPAHRCPLVAVTFRPALKVKTPEQ
jgi:hypothetical protein